MRGLPWTCSAAIVLSVAAAILAYELTFLVPLKGWWLDEYFSLWSTDPSNSFANAFAGRFRDTTPPLYYTALFWFRRFIRDEHVAVVCLNISALAAALITICLASRKATMTGWALVGFAVFLCSGPVLSALLEARVYLLALCITLVVSWFSALAVTQPDTRPGAAAFALVGGLAGLTHLYAALFCCCSSAGLLLVCLLDRRRDVMRPAMAMGIASAIIATAFLVWAIDLAPTWITFSLAAVSAAISEMAYQTFGFMVAVAIFAAVLASALLSKQTRPMATLFASAWIMFLLLPVLASFWRPMVTGRYLLVGAPSAIVFLLFGVKHLTDRRPPGASFTTVWLAIVACGALLTVMNFGGYHRARLAIVSKPDWRGADLVASRVRECPRGSVHVYPALPNLFAVAAGAPENVFVDAKSPRTEFIGVAASKCDVLGWAEHVFHGEHAAFQENFVLTASDEELLHILRIDAAPAEVRINRHWSGYVVTRP